MEKKGEKARKGILTITQARKRVHRLAIKSWCTLNTVNQIKVIELKSEIGQCDECDDKRRHLANGQCVLLLLLVHSIDNGTGIDHR